jgi:hypothetical protein
VWGCVCARCIYAVYLLIGEQVVQELGRGQQTWTTKVLRVLEHQEEVQVANEDTNELHDTTTGDDHVEPEQHPWQVHGFELSAKPKVNNRIFVQLAPNVKNGQDQRVHQEGDVHAQPDHHGADPGK